MKNIPKVEERVVWKWNTEDGKSEWYEGTVSGVSETHVSVRYDDGNITEQHPLINCKYGITWRYEILLTKKKKEKRKQNTMLEESSSSNTSTTSTSTTSTTSSATLASTRSVRSTRGISPLDKWRFLGTMPTK